METEGRSCLCNALMANIGFPQDRDGYTELPLYTGGDVLLNLPLGSIADLQYDADDVLDYLYSHPPPQSLSGRGASAALSLCAVLPADGTR